jgi:methylmalonyl-CoA mutase N-terminal domain/subunit
VVDPLAGSFYVEALTNEVEKRILDELEEIEKMGGLVEAVDSGWLHSKVANFIQREQKMIETGEIKVVGKNVYKASNVELPAIEASQFNTKLYDQMKAKLEKLREKRDNDKVESALKALVDACKKGENITYRTVEAARADATEGEMRKAFTEAFGTWRPPIFT